MATRRRKVSKKRKLTLSFALIIIVLLFLLAGFFAYRYFLIKDFIKPIGTNNYLIQNKYYGFEVKTPKNWIAEAKTIYSEDNISQLLYECQLNHSNEASAYEVGRFRFKDQKYPEGFGDVGYFPSGLSSGAILDVTVNCVPNINKNEISVFSYASLETAGEKTFSEFLDLIGFGKTKILSFFHNNLQYTVSEQIYISPAAKANEQKIRNNYSGIFNGIISSIKFIK